MDPMYIEAAYIRGLYLFCDSFEWFCLQITNKAKYFPSTVKGILVEE